MGAGFVSVHSPKRPLTQVGWAALVGITLFGPGTHGQPMPERTTVRGRVLDQSTNKPIRGAGVVLRVLDAKGKPTARTLPIPGLSGAPTDAQGCFVMQDVPEGKYYLAALMTDYKTSGQHVTVSLKSPLNVTVKLVKFGRFSFKAVAPGGKPVAKKTVYLAMTVNRKWHSSSCKSDAQGNCRLPCNCRPSRVLARALGIGSGDITVDPKQPYDPKLQIQLGAMCTVTGVVKEKDPGRPVAGIRVCVTSAGGHGKVPSIVPHPAINAKTDGKGRFVLKNVPPGVCSVGLSDSRILRFSPAKLQLSPGQEAKDMEFPVLLAPEVRGRILGVTGRPLATTRNATLRMWARQPDGECKEFSAGISVGLDGRFQTYAKSLGQTQFGVLIANEGWGVSPWVEVASGKEVQAEIQLKPFLTLAGKVEEAGTARPAPGASVKAAPTKGATPTLASPAEANANHAGEFVMQGLAPGVYSLTVQAFGYDASPPLTVKIEDGQTAGKVRVKLKKSGGSK